MPKVSTPTIKTSQKSLFVFVYGKKRVLATRQDCYDSAILACRKLFPSIPRSHQISFHTKDLEVCNGEMTEISTDSWEVAIHELKEVTVVSDAPQQEHKVTLPPSPPLEITSQSSSLNLLIDFREGATQQIKVGRHKKAGPTLTSFFQRQYGYDFFDNYRVTFDGNRFNFLDDKVEFGDMFLDGDSLEVGPVQRGGKPVIYLFSPETIEASVQLSLVPHWNLSAIYPVVPIKSSTPQTSETVTWRVRVDPSGDLTELTTGLNVAYLFWEAHTNPGLPASPPASPRLQDVPPVETFDPTHAVITNENAVVMSVENITPYLDRALKALGLHTEARTSFITYWLPSFLRHKNVAFRFLPQAAYEKAAPLDVSPAPDVVTRIFMVFQGLQNDELHEWEVAQAKVAADVRHWIGTVGVDIDRTLDTQLFRVIEWGGMEVLRSG